MRRIEVDLCMDLASDEIQFLGELADAKHCTLAEMVEEAVSQFVNRQKQRQNGAEQQEPTPSERAMSRITRADGIDGGS